MSSDTSRLRVAMVGTRGVPAHYGGFETAIEEIGSRLAERGVEVTVYCRPHDEQRPETHRGMRLVHLPALRVKVGETLSHTALSALHMLRASRYDAVFVFNAANAPFLPLLRCSGTGVAVHVDGLEWKRSKWDGKGRAYYRWAEQASVRGADALIADARGIADYYRSEFDAATRLLTYGAPETEDIGSDKLGEVGLSRDGFHLVVARFEPENHVDLILKAYRESNSRLPLAVVGSAPYAEAYTERIRALAESDSRIKLMGGVWDQGLLNQMYTHARTYLHGHSVGGTNPSLLRAMGAGTAVLAYDVVFNREVLGEESGRYFSSVESLAESLVVLDSDPVLSSRLGRAAQERAQGLYRWDEVAEGYLTLARDLATGKSTRNPKATRNPHSAWTADTALSPLALPFGEEETKQAISGIKTRTRRINIRGLQTAASTGTARTRLTSRFRPESAVTGNANSASLTDIETKKIKE
ncbi:glycosyltransferase involved in cell wall biosynthesis [Arthrobacter sp. UYP6]|uniref:DUF1972 domain-containing protein n=1 Tax=Arthrobacter sp. UYP6 TaxID=1756378 RepID=UPI00339B3C42